MWVPTQYIVVYMHRSVCARAGYMLRGIHVCCVYAALCICPRSLYVAQVISFSNHNDRLDARSHHAHLYTHHILPVLLVQKQAYQSFQ